MIGNVGVIDALLDKLEGFEPALANFTSELFQNSDIADYMADLQQGQLEEGIRSDGSEITPPYKSRTVAIKEYKGQPTDKVRLKDTGEFYQDIKVAIVSGDKIEMINTNWKTEMLKAKYLPQILGLTAENINRVRLRILPDYRSFATNYFRS